MPSRKRTSLTFARARDTKPAVGTEETAVDEEITEAGTDVGAENDVLSLADEAEAEAAEAEAAAAAARARARALRLRRQAEQARAARIEAAAATDEPDVAAKDIENIEDAENAGDIDDAGDAATEDVATEDVATEDVSATTSRRPRRALRIPLPTGRAVAFSAAIVVIAALLAASGYMIWHHQQVNRTAQREGEYAAAGRQAVVTLMSLDFNNAKEDVQRIIDNSTGKFREDFQAQAETFAQVAQESKVVTEVTVNTTAVKSMDDTTANVLVSATSRVTNTSGANQDPRAWRLSVDLQRDGDQIKMSRVEFVP